MASRDAFVAGLRAATAGTASAVEPRQGGLDLRVDVRDARWHGELERAGVRGVTTCRVVLDGDAFSAEQIVYRVTWTDGVPVRASASGSRGRFVSVRRTSPWRLGDDFRQLGDPTPRYTSEEGLALVRTVAGRLGLTERQPTSVRIAMVCAALGLSGVVLIPLAWIGHWLGWW